MYIPDKNSTSMLFDKGTVLLLPYQCNLANFGQCLSQSEFWRHINFRHQFLGKSLLLSIIIYDDKILNSKYHLYSNCSPGVLLFFYPKNKNKTLQIVLHCDIIWGCATIKFYAYMHATMY